jgi:hypothetical protein
VSIRRRYLAALALAIALGANARAQQPAPSPSPAPPVRLPVFPGGVEQVVVDVVVADGQAVISPSWSIHCGAGTGSYAFCWGMGGENQAFDDMDHLSIEQLR